MPMSCSIWPIFKRIVNTSPHLRGDEAEPSWAHARIAALYPFPYIRRCSMVLTIGLVAPIVALIAGILILLVPRISITSLRFISSSLVCWGCSAIICIRPDRDCACLRAQS